MLKRLIYLISVIISMLTGLVIGSLYYLGYIETILYGVVTALIITIIIFSIIILLVSFIYRFFNDKIYDCFHSFGVPLLIGVLGTVITTTFLMTSILEPTDLYVVGLVCLTTFFFLLQCITFLFTIACSVNCIIHRCK